MYPLKRFSQNFLNNPYYCKKIVEALEIDSDDYVLEIGPGKGSLTKHIIEAAPKRYIAVEIDRRWSAYLKEQFKGRVDIINQDFMGIDLNNLFSPIKQSIKIIGNLPYNITSPIIFKLIDNYREIDAAVLMTQNEVARRISSGCGGKEYGILSVTCQTYSKVEYLFKVDSGNFFPAPKVDSAVIKLSFFNEINKIENEPLYRQLVRKTFNYRRKMLRNSLGRIFDKSIVYSLEAIDLNKRPEELTIQEFKNLANELNRKLRQTHD